MSACRLGGEKNVLVIAKGNMKAALTAAIGTTVLVVLLAISPAVALIVGGLVSIAFALTSQGAPVASKPKDADADEYRQVYVPEALGVRPTSPSSRVHVKPPAKPPATPGPSDGVRRVHVEPVGMHDPLYENHIDHALYRERLNRNHEQDARHYHTNARTALEQAARADLPLRDPNLRPLDSQGENGCPRDLTRW